MKAFKQKFKTRPEFNINLFLNFILIGCFFVSLMGLQGCKATEAQSSGFLKNHKYMHNNPNLPFHKIWVRKNLNLRKYNKIMIKPINMNYLLEVGEVGKFNFKNYKRRLDENKEYLAKYFRNSLRNSFAYSSVNRFKVTNKRAHGTLVLHIAIVEFIPTKAVVNSATSAFMFVPIVSIPLTLAFAAIMLPIRTAIKGTTDSGFESSIAFEAAIYDSVTKKVLVAFADRESQPASFLHLNDYSYFSYIDKIMNDWSLQIVQTLNRRGNEEIEDSSAFVFAPW
jgi:hypothetical protein